MKFQRVATVFLLVAAVPGFCQTETQAPTATPDDSAQNDSSAPTDDSSWRSERTSPASNLESDEMKMPPPLRTAEFPMEVASRKPPRSNYVSGGLRFMNSFNDNIGSGFSARRISDNSYSVMPTLSWSQSSSRILWNLAYAPGFTVYQHHSELNHFPQKLSLDSQFRLSPHITLSVLDRFEKTADPFSQLTPDVSTSAGLSPPAVTIISPVTDQIKNLASAQLTYQFGLNSMIGARGLFNDLHYLNSSQVPGFANSHSKVAEGFYSHRVSAGQYLGAKYAYQSLLATPDNALTETHGVELFYTIYLRPTTSLSFHAGPQYSDSGGGGLPPTKAWSPSYGGSLVWQGQRMSLAVSGGRSIGAGLGLQGAVHTENASASVSRQLTKSWTASVRAFYWNNALLTPQLSPVNEGHSIEGTVWLRRRIKESLNLELEYTRLHQSYHNLSTLSASPNTNRVGVSLLYEFTKPIGR